MSDFLDADELRAFRSYVPWNPPEDASVQIVAQALGSWEAAAVEYVRTRLSEIAVSPNFSVPGEYSESYNNASELRKMLDELLGMIPADEGGSGVSVGYQERVGRTRR